MNWLNTVWTVVGAACLTLALVHALIWWQHREGEANALFSILAAGTALLAACEYWMARAETPEEFGRALRWIAVPAWIDVLAVVGFVRLYFRAGRPWLGWTVVGLRSLSLILNFLFSPNLNFRNITAIERVPFLGDTISSATGTHNPWMMLGQFSFLLLIVFVIDGSITVWRRGERRRAWLVGGSIVLFAAIGTAQTIVSLWGILPIPITASWFFLGVIAVMSFELSGDVLRTSRLVEELRESEERMILAAEAARLGMWVRDFQRAEIWATSRWRELFGFTSAEPLTLQKLMARIHADDRDQVERTLRTALDRRTSYEMQYRIALPDGSLRWIGSSGRALPNGTNGHTGRMLGASMDITAHRIAEEEARALSGRLIHAQEEERRRIARELHDDLNQRLALLSVEMELFGRDELPEKSAARFALLVTQLRELSSDLHKLAYELHPVKLEQLGLVAATGSLCGELSHQYGVAIQFIHGEIPPEIPGDTALCLFRVTQESLHNVVRHSGAKQASVVLSAGPDLLHLAISDPGSGFNFEAIPRSGGLGLVSMRERVRSIRGTIEIHSRPGEGTRVELTVPLSRKEPSL